MCYCNAIAHIAKWEITYKSISSWTDIVGETADLSELHKLTEIGMFRSHRVELEAVIVNVNKL